MKLGYLGPEGTFSEQAALKFIDKYDIIPFHTIWEVLENVNSGVVDAGIVPIENSTEGTINVTVDSITFDTDLFIQSEIILNIEQNLLAKPGYSKSDIIKVVSHPQPLAQCQQYLRKNFPNAETVSVNSTADASRIVKESNEPIASIGIKRCADVYGLNILEECIQDKDDNYTNFVLVSKNDTSMPDIGSKITIAFSILSEPGQLYRVLDIMAIWDINMTKIISRPMRNKTGEYVFFVDMELNNEKQDILNAIEMLKRKTVFFKILGSYSVFDYRLQK